MYPDSKHNDIGKVTVNPKRNRDHKWDYFLTYEGEKIKICCAYLLKIYQISEKRLRIIQQKVLSNDTFEEKRGPHNNRPHKIGVNVWKIVKDHLNSISS